MPDFRVAETAAEHPKLRTVGLAAAGLWSMAGAYSMRELTDGWVPEYWVLTWPGARPAVKKLVEVGLWSKEARLGIPGYRFHDWLSIQRSAASVEAERAEGRERARKSRLARKASGERSGEASPEAVTHVRPESHDSRALPGSFPSGSSGEGSSGSERGQDRNAPRPRCPDHAQLPADQRPPACSACKRLRLQAEEQAAEQAELAASQRSQRRALIDDCPDCDHNGMRDLDALGLGRCTHPSLTVGAS